MRPRNGKFVGHALDPKTKRYAYETYPTWEEAATWAEKERGLLVNQLATIEKGQSLLRDIADELKRDLILHKAAQATVDQLERVVSRAIAAGITSLDQPDLVKKTREFLTGLQSFGRKPASDATKNSQLKVLRALTTWAIDQEMVKIRDNPFRKIPYIPVATDMREVFSLDEVRRLVDPKNRDHNFYRPMCALLYTGFRIGEMANMDWSWFAWDQQRLRLMMAIKARARRNLPEGWKPKNRRARITRLMPELAEVMLPIKEDAGLVFPHLQPISNKARQNRFDDYVTHCGIVVGDRTPHATRATWTCLMLASGENETLVQQYAGHSEKEMTKHYALQMDLYRHEVESEGWKRGELSLRAPPNAPKPAVQAPPIRMPVRKVQ